MMTTINKRIILQICLTTEIPNTKLGCILEITSFIKKRFDRTDEENNDHPDWFATFYFATSWDKPEDWSGKNIVVALTPKGKQYLSETLDPKFYEKYKDVEIYLDDEGNIIGSNADTAVKA